jgi:hypothetical protein
VTCALGPYNFEFMLDVVREIAARYDVDGIFANRWSGSGTCYCEHCAASFRAESGLDLPRGGDIRDAGWRAYDAWREKLLFEQWRLWDDAIRGANPKTVFIPNVGGGVSADLDMATIGRMLPLGVAEAGRKVEGPIDGWHQALIEARIPFEMVHDQLLAAALSERFRLLILPNIAALSDAQCEALRGFVARGGSLLATFETSLYDELGRRREDFALGDLFGVKWSGTLDGPMKNAYLRLNHGAQSGGAEGGPDHPVLAGLEDAPRIIHGLHRLGVEPRVAFPDRPITLIPSYPDLPMEEVYPRGERPDVAELYLRRVDGGGRVAYFNWDIDRAFWEVLAADHGRLMANAVRWALDEVPRVEVLGAGVMDVAIWRQAASLTVHLVNLTNPMMMKGPCRELIPSPPQEVRIRLGALGIEPSSVRAVKLLVSGKRARHTLSEDACLVVQVPPVLDHEVVAVDLA